MFIKLIVFFILLGYWVYWLVCFGRWVTELCKKEEPAIDDNKSEKSEADSEVSKLN